MLTSA